MANLSRFRRNTDAIRNGEWIEVGDEYGDLQILTRGMTDAYVNGLARRQRAAAAQLPNGDPERLPVEIQRGINIACLIEFLVLDVRNLVDDQQDPPAPVTIEQFREMLRDPDYLDLVNACYRAALRVGRAKQAIIEDGEGNSGSASPTS